MFKELEPIPNLPEQEEKVSKFWEELDPVAILKSERSKSDKKKVYYDGPITANGLPHYGHAITWTLKDLIPRYWTMKGYYVERNMGWDCQGIPVEYEVEKELGFEKKEDIEAFGVAKFNDLCRQSITKYRDSIFRYENLLGRWFDKDAVYSTMENDYLESMWWSLKELYTKGLLYEGYKVVAYSTRAGTTLSSHEVAEGGYKDMEDPFVTVKFQLKNEEDTYFLAWTTTPWTIPGSLMLAVNKDVTYVKVRSRGQNYILAEKRLDPVFESVEHEILEKISGADLIGVEYIPPYNYYESKRAEGCFKTIYSYHATEDDGTGIVHLAPYGEEDFDIFMGLGITLFDYLDDTANFTAEIPEYAGKFYRDANPIIVEDLNKMGRLFSTGTIIHRMPMCWRTKTPLIYKPIKSWYISIAKLKDRMLEENNKINWYPEHIKEGNSKMWIQNARDWALSRSRYWGTPLPVWINDKTQEKVFVGSVAELKELSGVELQDLHRPYVDEVVWEDKANGGSFRRVKDVIDVWYDSGSMPFARWHYPFENTDQFNDTFPAEFIAEGPDQVRLWFYTMHVLGVALFDKIPYQNVVTIGMMLDETGKKMSKSVRNYKPLDTVLSEYGADVLRLFILTSSIVDGQDAIFSADTLKDARKGFFLPLWNSMRYFVTYANEHNFVNTLEEPKTQNILDKWILTRLKETVSQVNKALDSYTILEGSRKLEPFVTDFSTWYIRRSRDRIKSGDIEALSTTYFVLTQFTKLIAPFMPFFSETMYETLQIPALSNIKSVHLDSFPKEDALTDDEDEILKSMAKTREIVTLALAIRSEKGIKIRQPLSKALISEEFLGTSKYYDDLILDEINIKSIDVVTQEAPVSLDLTISEELKSEGIARELVRKFQDLRKETGLQVSDRINAQFENSDEFTKAVSMFEEMIKQKINADNIKPGDSFKIEKI